MSQGMLGLLPLSAVRGPRAAVDELLAGPEGPKVLRLLIRFGKKQSVDWGDHEEVKEPRVRLDNRIEVDRSKSPTYPDWVTDRLYPDFEKTGPSKYRLNKIESWSIPSFEVGEVTGGQIHVDLRDKEILQSCLGLADAIEIQKKGGEVYRKFFGDKTIYFWKSVVRSKNGSLFVPYLREQGGVVVLDWYSLRDSWYGDKVAIRFAR